MNQVHQRHSVNIAPSPPSGGASGIPVSGNSDSSKARPRPRRVKTKRTFGAFYASSDKARLVMMGMGCLAMIAVLAGIGALCVALFSSGFGTRRTTHNNKGFEKLINPKSMEEMYDEKHTIPFNPIYTTPEAMKIVGDRSDRYARLRQEIDPLLPDDAQRSLARVKELTTHQYTPISMDAHNSDQVAYDIYDCPDEPPVGYPFSWNLVSLLQHWPADDPTPRSTIHQGLCVFDYQKDYDKAMHYRDKELPFVVMNDPAVAKAVERWNQPGYMHAMLGEEPHRCEYSENNHFMYYVPVPKKRRAKMVPDNWKEPTTLTRIPYDEWLQHANVSDDSLGPDKPHWYYRLIGCGLMGNDGSCDRGSSEYLYDELPFFQPKQSLYIVDAGEQKGIHCRFGMKGVIAENHFDGSRNSIALLGGSRRYILTHPDQCPYLALYKKGHPSARHSEVDWSNPDLEKFPAFKQAKANEVVMQPGQVLYLPTNWFHFIVSLELNFQCNTRSGISQEYMPPIHACGF